MACEYRMMHRVEFTDTDMAGIIHFSAFFRYMEVTEHAFFRSLGLSIQTRDGNRALGWPRVRVECEFSSPLRFEDEVEVHLRVREKRSKSLTYDFRFRKQDVEVAKGSLTAVCVAEESGRMKAVTIPALVADRIQVAPEWQGQTG